MTRIKKSKYKLIGLKLIIIYFILSISFSAFSNENMGTSNELFNQKKYKKSLLSYKNLIDSNAIQPNLYYNIGNCYSKLGNLGMSILYLEKAVKFKPHFNEAKINLTLEKEKANINSNQEIENSIYRKLNQKISINFWNYLALFTSLFSGILFFLAIKYKKNIFLFSAIISSILLFFFMILSYQQNRFFTSSKQGIVIKETNLREYPNADSELSYSVSEGTKLIIINKQKHWFEVELNNEELWIPSIYFKEI